MRFAITTLILYFLISPFLLFSQLKNVTGRTTGLSDVPLEYAEVNLLSKDSTTIKTGFTINRDFSTEVLSADKQPLPGGYTASKNLGNQTVNNYAFKSDLETKIKGIKLSDGLKLSFTQTDNDLRYYNNAGNVPVLIDSLSNTFKA